VSQRLYLCEQAEIAPDALPSGCEVRRFRTPDELPADDRGALIVATADQAGKLVAPAPEGCPIVLWGEGASDALLAHPRVAGALDACSDLRTVQALLAAALKLSPRLGDARTAQMLERALEIGRALAAERDLDTLLGLILTHARLSTGADGASIYTRGEGGALYFRLWQNASMTAARAMPVGEDSIAGYVARSGEPLVLDDAYAIPAGAPYRFNAAFDRERGYRTRSLLTIPLKNKAGEVIGVLQLVNRKERADVPLASPEDVARLVSAFDVRDVVMAQALAGPAGVALENSLLYADIERLFEGFVRASVQAIEARDPTTAGHSFRVADYTGRLAVAADRADGPALRGVRFSREQMRELHYAALLHDFGKVGVREHVLVKAKKLYPAQLELLRQRFRYARACLERRAWREILDGASRREETERRLARELARLDEFLALVLRANEPTVLPREAGAGLDALARFRFPGEDGEPLALLHDFELSDLAIAKGSLNDAERAEIESHVSHTFEFLSLIPWTRDLAALPRIARGHHEKLDGSGYPHGLTGADIPVQTRIMTIADIYDALTAPDRPYKRSLPPERALDILRDEARAGKVDTDLFEVFVASRTWQATH
jgi:HD-GYP domain-containing protein (c-di-GMP phosphodiesterase class II)